MSKPKKIEQLKSAAKSKDQLPVPKIGMDESELRVEKLSQTIFETVNQVLQIDEFNHYEITDALLRVCHNYNKRALDHQKSIS